MTEYTERQLRDITMAALSEYANIPDSQSECRKRAQVVLDRMRAEDRASGPAEPDQWRLRVGPDLAVVVDAPGCIVLEVSEGELPGARVLRRVTVTDVSAVFEALTLARMHVLTDDAGGDQTAVPGGVEFCGDPMRHAAHEYEGGHRWCEGIG